MDDNARNCALPGCMVIIEDVQGRPARRYCSAAHRSAARQARRAATQIEQAERLAVTLPWLREPEDAVASMAVPGPRSATLTARGTDEPAIPAPRVPVPDTAPPRRDTRFTALPRPGARFVAPTEPKALSRGTRLTEPLPRRRRALAVLGAAGILAGGYAVTASEPMPLPAAPLQSTPAPLTEDEWAAGAEITLASLNQQLDTIARTEAEWIRTAQQRSSAAPPPAPVRALADRKELLERRKATLQLQLEAYRSLSRTKSDLVRTEQDLRNVEEALRDATAAAERSPEQATVVAALGDQRDLRLFQRDAKRQELVNLEENVGRAARAPVPADGEETAEVSDEVLEVIRTGRDGDGDKPGGDPIPPRPDVVGREQQQSQERQDTATSGPPDPRGPGDEDVERRRNRDARADGGGRGPVGEVVDTVGDVGGGLVGGGPGKPGGPGRGDGDGADKPRDARKGPDRPAAGDGGRGPVEGVVDTVGDTVGGGDRGADPSQGGDRDRDRADRPPEAEAVQDAPKVAEPPVDAPQRRAPDAQPRAEAPVPDASQRRAPETQPRVEAPAPDAEAAPAPGGADRSGGDRRDVPAEVPGSDIARAVVGSVPGGQLAAPQVESALEEAAQQDAPQRSGPQESAPQESAPQRSAPQRSAPQESAPRRSAPVDSAPRQMAPKQVAPEQVAPKQVAPQRAAPEQDMGSGSQAPSRARSTPQEPSDAGASESRSASSGTTTTRDSGGNNVTRAVQQENNTAAVAGNAMADRSGATVTSSDGSRTVSASNGSATITANS